MSVQLDLLTIESASREALGSAFKAWRNELNHGVYTMFRYGQIIGYFFGVDIAQAEFLRHLSGVIQTGPETVALGPHTLLANIKGKQGYTKGAS